MSGDDQVAITHGPMCPGRPGQVEYVRRDLAFLLISYCGGTAGE